MLIADQDLMQEAQGQEIHYLRRSGGHNSNKDVKMSQAHRIVGKHHCTISYIYQRLEGNIESMHQPPERGVCRLIHSHTETGQSFHTTIENQ